MGAYHPDARPEHSAERQVASVTGPLILIMSLMLLLSVGSLLILSALRAYVNGESMWSKAERQSILELQNYYRTGDESYYQRFGQELSVPLGDRRARLELLSAHPDYAAAAQGFLAGGSHPHDIPGLIVLFRLFHGTALMAPAIDIWVTGDDLIAQTQAAALQLHEQMQGGPFAAQRAAARLTDAEAVHARAVPLENAFSAVLGDLSRELTALLIGLLAACALALVALGQAISRRNLQRGARLASALKHSQEMIHAEQERAQVTLGAIADAVISIDPSRRIAYMNAAAEALTGWSQRDAQGQELASVLRIAEDSGHASVTRDLDRVSAGEALDGTAGGVLLQRRDGTQVPVHERAAPIRCSTGEVNGIVLVLRDIAQERVFAARLKHQATHDSLTGLTNRHEFEAQLGAALAERARSGDDCALLYLDLDQFKVINDICGHAAGDELIRQVAWLIRGQLRAGDVLARLGGDEFGALLPRCSAANAVALAESIRQHIADGRFRWGDKLFRINASIGVLGLNDTQGTVGDALSAADQACYLAKDTGRNRVQLYRPDDQEVRSRHGEMRWVERLHAAIEQDSFVLVAQEIRPINRAELRRGRLSSQHFELLVRMIAEDGTLVAPMAFIPAAERYGLMPRIDRWIISHACRQLATLEARGVVLPTCMINLSGASVSDTRLADFIGGCLNENGLSGRHIGFEVTETAAIDNLASAAHLMSRLRALGCPIALDDFGAGMCSFSYLKSLPVDFLKIDGGFVRDITTDPIDAALVEAIQRIARLMGLQTIAECVEDQAALEALQAIEVDYAQGFHIRRPIPLAQIEHIAGSETPPQALSA